MFISGYKTTSFVRETTRGGGEIKLKIISNHSMLYYPKENIIIVKNNEFNFKDISPLLPQYTLYRVHAVNFQ